MRSFLTRRRRTGREGLPLLSVNLPSGVVPRRDGDGRPAPSADMSGYQWVRRGDLVMNQLGKPHGALGVSDFEGVISPAYFVAEVGPTAEPRFVHHLLRTRLYISEYERRGKYMPPSQFDISWEQFRTISVLLPTVLEQRAIADFLDAETARIEALITKKRRLIELLDERVEACVFASTTKGLNPTARMRPSGLAWAGDVPAHWGTPTVSAHFDLQLGKMLNSDAAAGPDHAPYLRNVNVQWDRFALEDLATMHFDDEDRRRCQLRVGDVLVCEGGEVGRAAVWAGELSDCFFQKAIHRARPRQGANGRYLMYCLRAAAKVSVFAVEGNQSTIVHLTGEQLRAHRFPWPPDEEQAGIVEHLDRLVQKVADTRSSVARQIDLLVEHRQALITAAVTGELSVPGVAA